MALQGIKVLLTILPTLPLVELADGLDCVFEVGMEGDTVD